MIDENNVVESTSGAKKVKPSTLKRIRTYLFDVDSDDIFSYMRTYVIKPKLLRFMDEAFTEMIHYIFSNGTHSSSSSKTSKFSFVDYTKSSIVDSAIVSNADYIYDDVEFDTYVKADEVLEMLRAYLNTYKSVSVARFYEFSKQPYHYTDRDWGWKDLSKAKVITHHDKYVIKLPKAIPLEK